MDDQQFEQQVAALESQAGTIEKQLRAVPAERWDVPLHGGENGWSRRQLLAHIATNDLRQLTRVRVGAGIAGAAEREELAAQAQVDTWNHAQVGARAGRSVDDLIAEMKANRGALVSLLRKLTPEQRARPVPFRGGQASLTEMLPLLLGHIEDHAREISG